MKGIKAFLVLLGLCVLLMIGVMIWNYYTTTYLTRDCQGLEGLELSSCMDEANKNAQTGANAAKKLMREEDGSR